ncbi:MAG: hypothetical protein AB8G05_18685 [Oligoflexales bacterium]
MIIILSYFVTFCSSNSDFKNIASKTSGGSTQDLNEDTEEEEEEEIPAVPPTIISGAYLACNMIGKNETSNQVSASCSLQKEDKVVEIPNLLETDFEVKDGDRQIPLTNFSYMGSGYYELTFTDTENSKVSIGLNSVQGKKVAEQNPDLLTNLETKTDPQEYETKDLPKTPDETPTTNEIPEVQGTKKPRIDCNKIGIPGSWVFVSGDPKYQTNDFCVMKFEAKEDNGLPISTAARLPWVNIKQTEAIDACTSLGPDYHLISNHEWMSIASNVIKVDANWTGGTPGIGKVVQGNSDASTETPCAADIDDLNSFVNADCQISANSENPSLKRTHIMTNSNIIWDLAGNVWEWTGDTILPSSKPGPNRDEYMEYTEPVIATDPEFPLTELIPQLAIDNLWNSEQGMGEYYSGEEDQGGVIRRGGDFDNISGGLFSARLSDDADKNRDDIGFRCVRRIR